MRSQASAIRAYWQSQWGATAPTAYENESFTTPDEAPWVRFRIRPAGADQITLGTPSIDRHSGLVHIAVFAPLGEGEGRAMWLADKAADIFRKVAISGITFGVPWTDILGSNGEGWWMIACTCPFFYDELT